MDKETIIYIVVFVGIFLFNLLRDRLAATKKKNEAMLQKMEQGNEPSIPVQSVEQESAVASRSGDSSIENLLKSLQEDIERREAQERLKTENVSGNNAAVIKTTSSSSHTNRHRQSSHHHQEAKSKSAPRRAEQKHHDSPFLSTEEMLFSDRVDRAAEEVSQNNNSGKSSVYEQECPMRTAADKRRAFLYSEIWNRKYC